MCVSKMIDGAAIIVGYRSALFTVEFVSVFRTMFTRINFLSLHLQQNCCSSRFIKTNQACKTKDRLAPTTLERQLISAAPSQPPKPKPLTVWRTSARPSLAAIAHISRRRPRENRLLLIIDAATTRSTHRTDGPRLKAETDQLAEQLTIACRRFCSARTAARDFFGPLLVDAWCYWCNADGARETIATVT